METAAGQSCFENLCRRETLLQKQAFRPGMGSWSPRSLLILTSLLFLLHCFLGKTINNYISDAEGARKYICRAHLNVSAAHCTSLKSVHLNHCYLAHNINTFQIPSCYHTHSHMRVYTITHSGRMKVTLHSVHRSPSAHTLLGVAALAFHRVQPL